MHAPPVYCEGPFRMLPVLLAEEQAQGQLGGHGHVRAAEHGGHGHVRAAEHAQTA
jgi:hypothetical protein